MYISAIALAAVVGSAQMVVAQSIEFFYTETVDTCEIDSAYIQANQETTHGGVCAYRRDVSKVYGCPAPDPTCWTWGETCNQSNIGQTVCNRAGSVWCCNAVAGETCTTTSGQINVCISNFTSPNSGVSIAAANQVYLAAIGRSTVTSTSQAADPTPFSTRQLAATASTHTSSSSSTPSTTASGTSVTSLSTSTSTSASQSRTRVSTSTTSSPSDSSSLNPVSSNSGSHISGGAIAGIAIGVAAVLAILGASVFFFMRRKKRNTQNQSPSKKLPESSAEYGAHSSSPEKKHGDYYAIDQRPSELGTEGNSRMELPAGGPNSVPTRTYEMA